MPGHDPDHRLDCHHAPHCQYKVIIVVVIVVIIIIIIMADIDTNAAFTLSTSPTMWFSLSTSTGTLPTITRTPTFSTPSATLLFQGCNNSTQTYLSAAMTT
eukprot:3035666-Amphidinium_carterae.1